MKTLQLTARRPHILRAFYDWLLENDLSPHLVVDVDYADVRVPFEYVKNGQIILNISPNSVENLDLGNKKVSFNARFKGKIFQVFFPVSSILAIYAQENGVGTVFEKEASYDFLRKKSNSKSKKERVMYLIHGDRCCSDGLCEKAHTSSDFSLHRKVCPILRIV